VVNERKRKGDARNASICGKQENNGPASGQNVGRERSLPGDCESRLKKTCTQQGPLLLHMRCLVLVLESTGSNKAGTRPEDGSGRLMGAILVLINAAQMRLH